MLSLPCGRAGKIIHTVKSTGTCRKEGGINFESKNETKKAVEHPARHCDGGGNAACHEHDGIGSNTD